MQKVYGNIVVFKHNINYQQHVCVYAKYHYGCHCQLTELIFGIISFSKDMLIW